MEEVNESSVIEEMREDRAMLGSLLRHVVHADPSEDSSKFVLETFGGNLGADRCYVYRFSEPGKSARCTNTHEWCADGVASAAGEGDLDLSALEDFNACIASGRNFMFTDIASIDAASRQWLASRGVKSLVATPLVVGDKVLGFVGFDFVKEPRREFADRVLLAIEGVADILLASQRMHEREMAIRDIAHVSDHNAKTIKTMQDHQKFRADTLAYAFTKDDIPGLIDMMLHNLLELTECDYIAIHSVEGDHLMVQQGGTLNACPGRCEACSFYKLLIPPVEDEEHVIELPDAKGQTITSIPQECPAKSLEVAVVHCDGKPWGGIALHYLNRQRKISDHDRASLKICADVLTMALERRSAAAQLRAERDRVIESEKVRSYFFSSVSHDIRTPLNAIIGFSELLQAGGVPPEEVKQDLKMIVTSGRTLLQLVNDVLDLSRMDLGKLEFNLEPTSVGDVVRETAMMFQPQTKDRNQTIVTAIPEMPRLMVDPHRFRQVLFNFISNAVKYAGPCTIRVSVVYEGGVFKTTVADDGRGVSAEKAKLLMQPFVQADIKNRSEGSGLGLAICKRLVEIANGKIFIDTAPGKGFVIRTEVPVSVAPGETAAEAGDAAGAAPVKYKLPRRVLVVDDSPVNRVVLRAMLKKLGVGEIELAVDGGAALEVLQRDSSFDWVLTDMWMPVMDGSELVKRIRGDERLSNLKVCSVTADVEARDTYKDQGFDSLLLKPVTIDSLEGLFEGGDPWCGEEMVE